MVQAVLVEEDTHFVLSAPSRIRGEPEHPIRLMTELAEAKPAAPGSMVVRGKGPPYRFLAVVHDVERSPTWREEWIVSALTEAVAAMERRQLSLLATPVLGSRHGSMSPARFCELLRMVLEASTVSSLEQCWLLLPPLAPAERRRLERVLGADP
jgi:hypothetical protein